MFFGGLDFDKGYYRSRKRKAVIMDIKLRPAAKTSTQINDKTWELFISDICYLTSDFHFAIVLSIVNDRKPAWMALQERA